MVSKNSWNGFIKEFDWFLKRCRMNSKRDGMV
jgi:hypothetical protein